MQFVSVKALRFLCVFIILTIEISSFSQYAYSQSTDSAQIGDNQATTSAQNIPPGFFNPPASVPAGGLLAPDLSQSIESSPQLQIKPHRFVQSLNKSNFQAKEQVEVVVKNSDGKNLQVNVTGGSYTPQIASETSNGDTTFILYPNADLKPGRYKVSIVDTTSNQTIFEQDFTWGVLAINTDKSIYISGENANFAMAVLDEEGNMVCNAKVDLEITSPYGIKTHLSTAEGSISINPQCWLHQYTDKPDYEASYLTSDIGRYTLSLTANTNKGSYSTTDRFEVRSYVPFDIQRNTATRIYPPDKYPVKLKIHANEAFSGKIVESVPSDFQISPYQKDNTISYTGENTVSQNTDTYGIPMLHLPFSGDFAVTLGFGQQIDDPKESDIYKKSGLDAHDGIDFALPTGTPVLSVDDGKVILAKPNWIYGTSIVIQHKWGRSYYGHLSKLEVFEGDNILKSQEIGLSGATGVVTGAHLHFGLKPNNSDTYNLYFGKIDPAPFFGFSSEDSTLSISTYPTATKALVWNVEVAKGADFTLGYMYKAPPKSPNFYTIGPLQFISNKLKIQPQAKFDVNPFVLGSATSSGNLNASQSADVNSSSSANIQPQNNQVSSSEGLQSDTGQVIFKEIRPWQLAIDAATTIIIDSTYTDSCGTDCFTTPSNWNNANNSIEVIGGGGNGANATTALSGGGGGGGAYSKRTNQTISGTVNFHRGTAGGGPNGTGDTYFCNSQSNCTTGGSFGTAVIAGAHGGSNATTITGGNGGSVTGSVSDGGAADNNAGGKGGNGTNSARTPGAGGGGSAGPNGDGAQGGNGSGSTTNNGGSGGGANGGGSVGSAATSATGGNGGDIFGGGGHGGAGGSGAHTGGDGGSGDSGGGGGGGGGINANGTAGFGGTGSRGIDLAAGSAGSGGGGGGGGADARTAGGSKIGGDGGTPPTDTGAGGGGGGSAATTGGGLGNGSAGFIIVTYTPAGPTLDQLMRHGNWFSGGVEQSFTF